MGKQIRMDLALSLFFILLSVLIYWWIIPRQIPVPPQVRSLYLSPAFAPKVFVAFLGITSFVLMIVTLIRGVRKGHSVTSSIPNQQVDLHSAWKIHAIVLAIWLSCCAYIYAVEGFGIIPSSIVLLFVLTSYFGQKNKLRVAILAVVVPIAIYLFFTRLANVPFPTGLLFK